MSNELGATPAPQPTAMRGQRTRAILSGWLSMLLLGYDQQLPTFVLPAAMLFFVPPTLPPATRVTLVNLFYGITAVANPVGSLLIAPLGDRVGRRRLVGLCITTFTLGTVLIAALPGYAAWGYGAVACLLLLRVVTGVFEGAVAGGAAALSLEQTERPQRGLIGALVGIGLTLGVLILSFVQSATVAISPGRAFAIWGWRLPFLFAGVIAVVVYLLLRNALEVDLTSLYHLRRASPLREVFSGRYLRTFGQTFLIVLGFFFTVDIAVSFVPSLLIGYLHQPPPDIGPLLIASQVGILVLSIGYGAFSQRLGRKPALVGGGIGVAVLGTGFYYLMIRAADAHHGFGPVFAFGWLAMTLSLIPYSGVLFSYLAERFPIHIRATGLSSVFSLGGVIPGFYSLYLFGLGRVMPFEYTPLVLLALGGVLTAVGAALGPETRAVEVGAAELTAPLPGAQA
ncbi:MAG: MFS transporter [Firmicutes bacterium]|nr:MFS transporter [Alicyclobacillaceae bacterium]MCL6497431.1 MFS transporter [Bacillota bacterium]